MTDDSTRITNSVLPEHFCQKTEAFQNNGKTDVLRQNHGKADILAKKTEKERKCRAEKTEFVL